MTHTFVQSYMWREAFQGDDLCVRQSAATRSARKIGWRLRAVFPNTAVAIADVLQQSASGLSPFNSPQHAQPQSKLMESNALAR
jgi:hypothetical protein